MPGGGVENHSDIPPRLDRLEKLADQYDERLGKLERFQAWLTGIGVGAGAVVGVLIDTIRKKAGL